MCSWGLVNRLGVGLGRGKCWATKAGVVWKRSPTLYLGLLFCLFAWLRFVFRSCEMWEVVRSYRFRMFTIWHGKIGVKITLSQQTVVLFMQRLVRYQIELGVRLSFVVCICLKYDMTRIVWKMAWYKITMWTLNMSFTFDVPTQNVLNLDVATKAPPHN